MHVCVIFFFKHLVFIFKRKKTYIGLTALFSGIAPAILEAQTWSHFELGEKKKTSPL